jgi:hypothetical protein
MAQYSKEYALKKNHLNILHMISHYSNFLFSVFHHHTTFPPTIFAASIISQSSKGFVIIIPSTQKDKTIITSRKMDRVQTCQYRRRVARLETRHKHLVMNQFNVPMSMDKLGALSQKVNNLTSGKLFTLRGFLDCAIDKDVVFK